MAVKLVAFKSKNGIYYSESTVNMFKGKPEKTFWLRFSHPLTKNPIKIRLASESEGMTLQQAEMKKSEIYRMMMDGVYKTKQEIEEERQAKEAEKLRLEEEERKKNITLNQAFELYFNEYALTNKKSYYDDKNRYDNHIRSVLGDKALKDICSFDIERLKSNLQKKELSQQTIIHTLKILRQIYNKMLLWDKYSGDNPVSKLKIKKSNNNRLRFLTIDEAEILLTELKKHSIQVYDQSLLSLNTGMRFGEIAGLVWQDIDFENDIITIRDAKNNHTRQTYINGDVKHMLFIRLENKKDVNLVFPSLKGTIQDSVSKIFFQTANTLFNQGVTDARDKVVFHTLRHTFASWLAISGTPLHVIKELMGHKSISMTERYSHLIPDVKRLTINGLVEYKKDNKIINLKIVGGN